MADPLIENIVADMLAAGADAASGRLTEARDVLYWRALAPALNVERGQPVEEPRGTSSIDLAELSRHVSSEGYFRLESVLDPQDIARMRHGVETVRGEGWHPAFAFVYDEFWSICHSSPVVAVLTTLLGAGFRQTPKTWCHFVAAVDGARGWAPHVDGQPGQRRLTAWIPLSDATVDNGCMAVVPKSRAPQRLIAEWDECDSVRHRDVDTLLQHVRPLPAPAGSMLGWEMGVMHWGMVAHKADKPRISVSFDFVSAEQASAPGELSMLPDNRLPSFRERLTFIAQNLLDYERFEPELGRYRGLATRLLPGRR